MTSAQPEGRFGALHIQDNNQVLAFNEKPKGDGSWVNAGYFVCQPEVIDYIGDGDEIIFEHEPLINLAKDREIFTYKHKGFWMPMDTLREKVLLNKMHDSGKAPWMVWDK
jgi:glucose-1-phosphate cytidylyltransferase